LLWGCSGKNSYIDFDPEGVLQNGYIGMTTEELLSANQDLVKISEGNVVIFQKTSATSAGTPYLFLCRMKEDRVLYAQYLFRYESVEKQFSDAVAQYFKIKALIGEADYGLMEMGVVSEERLLELFANDPQSMPCLGWVLKDKYFLTLGIPFLHGAGGPVNILVIHAKR
jgi:hypothetical protein